MLPFGFVIFVRAHLCFLACFWFGRGHVTYQCRPAALWWREASPGVADRGGYGSAGRDIWFFHTIVFYVVPIHSVCSWFSLFYCFLFLWCASDEFVSLIALARVAIGSSNGVACLFRSRYWSGVVRVECPPFGPHWDHIGSFRRFVRSIRATPRFDEFSSFPLVFVQLFLSPLILSVALRKVSALSCSASVLLVRVWVLIRGLLVVSTCSGSRGLRRCGRPRYSGTFCLLQCSVFGCIHLTCDQGLLHQFIAKTSTQHTNTLHMWLAVGPVSVLFSCQCRCLRFVCLSLCLCPCFHLYLFLCLSVGLSVCLSVSVCVCVSVCAPLSVSPSLCFSFLRLSVSLCLSVFVCLSLSLSLSVPGRTSCHVWLSELFWILQRM